MIHEQRCFDALMPRIEKFARQWCPDWQNASIDLTAEIQKIIDEAWGEDDRDHFEKVSKRAAELAYEDAARIAETFYDWQDPSDEESTNEIIARQIRARAKEVT